MSRPLPDPPPGFDDLSVDDQIEYVQSLWDRVTAATDEVPVPEWHKEVIRKRVAELESNPGSAIPWEQASEEIAGRLGKK
jgi:putative addiction module component (TIGR02574 family)